MLTPARPLAIRRPSIELQFAPALAERAQPQRVELDEAFGVAMVVGDRAFLEGDQLLVQFESGERYVYVGVPAEVCRSFVDADSKGRFFQLHVRDRYPFNRLDS